MGTPRITGEALYSAILACIRVGTDTTNSIAAVLDFSPAAIHTRLHELKVAKRAHNARRGKGSDRQMVWLEGEDPKTVVVDSDYGDQPFRPRSDVYPNIGRRDYLVAALFGAPQASQAQGAV